MNFDADSSQSNWKLWGEEREEGAIYTIYLKKVRYQNPTKTLSLESDDERSHLEWETNRVKCIKAGTIEKLVNSLASDDGELEPSFVNIFLATYRTFTSPHHILSLLIERYEYLVNIKENLPESMINPHKKTVVSALHVWLDSYPEDFYDPPLHTCLRCLHSFTSTYLPKTDLHIRATYRLERFVKESKTLDTTRYVSDEYDLFIANTPLSRYNFPNIAERHFALQLTRMDRDALKGLIAHQCLGGVWSTNKRAESAPTVIATIEQFNAVILRVISTVLANNSDRPYVIETWINIAQELRVLKNFSSLKAIISGLQSNNVFRLKKTWHLVPQDKVELFEELARIFSEENNQWAQRNLLIREGTAKFADTYEHNDRHLQKKIRKEQSTTGKLNIGTIPYLGTFLTDLTMIHNATPDKLQDGLINFDKKRKEFEILAQIKLLQGASNSYDIPEDPVFDQWFHSILVLDDTKAFKISCQIEPLESGSLITGSGKKSNFRHEKNDSISSNCSSRSHYGLSDDGLHSPNNSLDKQDSLSSSSICSEKSTDSNNTNVLAKNSVNNSTFNTSSESYVIRITVDADNVETDRRILYKSIMLSNNDRTPQVIRSAMLKFCIDDDPENYTLSQILPDKEMILPTDANVYYAVNTDYDKKNLNFLLRKKMVKNNTITKK